MADLQDHAVEVGDPANVAVPTYHISGKLVEGSVVLHDFTGANAIVFPNCLAQLTIAQRDLIVQKIKLDLINFTAGITE